MRAAKLLIVDANVLIDFCHSDRTLLSLVDRHLGAVHVSTAVLAKVDQLTDEDVRALGLTLVEVDTELLADAVVRAQDHPLAPDDWVSLLLAKANGWTCVTNDKRLRAECGGVGVEVMWGLELLLGLVRDGALPAKEAEDAAWAIHRSNKYVTKKVVEEFCEKIHAKGRRA